MFMDSNDVLNLAKTGNTVVSALEKLFPYWNLEGKALDVYIKEIEKSDKPKEVKAFEILNAKQSFRRIKNVKSILELTSSFVSQENVRNADYKENEEWFDQFWDKASNISDEKAQVIWSKILANEIQNKGSTPKGIFRVLSEIDSSTANAFNKLCEQKLMFFLLDENSDLINLFTEVVMFDDHNYYKSKGLSLEVLNELEAIGLISTSLGYNKSFSRKVSKVLISDGSCTECIVLQDKQKLDFGTVMLTKTGLYLSRLIDAECSKDQMSVMKDYYIKHRYTFEENNKIQVKQQAKGSYSLLFL